MRKFQCLLFVLKRSYAIYYVICMIVTLKDSKEEKSLKLKTFKTLQYNIIRIFDINSK